MKKPFSLLVATIAITGSLTAIPAHAMGSGNKYQDPQTGVTYGIYQPTTTLGLPALNFEVRPCRIFPKQEEYLLAGFGGMDQGIALVETSAQFNCTGLDNPLALPNTKINGVVAKVGIYCPTSKCTAAQFTKFGGEITFTTPATKYFSKSLRPTFIRVGTQGGFTLKQLITFASGLKRVGSY